MPYIVPGYLCRSLNTGTNKDGKAWDIGPEKGSLNLFQ